MSLTSKLLSGIETRSFPETSMQFNTADYVQNFLIPASIVRGFESGEVRMPPITGFSVMAGAVEGDEDITAFDWRFERYVFGVGWRVEREGTYVGFPSYGEKVWADVYFEPLPLDPDSLTDEYQIVVSGKPGGPTKFQSITVGADMVTINGINIPMKLRKDTPHTFLHGGIPSVIRYDADRGWTFSHQQTPSQIWYGNENGVATYRLLTASGDEGRDFLGNAVRHSIFVHGIENVTTVDGEKLDKHWFSKPNPSRFAVESMYFDISENGQPAVIDSILLDPITPDVFFSVYYTSEGDPEENSSAWDEKLWARVNRTFQAKQRDTHLFPEPIKARYIKVEFTHLQPRPYQPGPFQQAIRYQKHPKWVLDYFLLRLEHERLTEDQFIARRVNITFSALDIAFNYYLDDLKQTQDAPVRYDPSSRDKLGDFITDRSDSSDKVDPVTLNKINLSLNAFRQGSSAFVKTDNLLGEWILRTSSNQPVESVSLSKPSSVDVSTLNRDRIVVEQSFPVTFFHLTARHRYREVQAEFAQNRAYFVGVREVAFLRERYSKATDTTMYVEIGGDTLNIESSDFIYDDNALVIPDDAY